ncbi:PREDICTED: serine/threonine-protein phosphatase 6 regulatory ankyrin repeat subunit B-like [Nicotiana attenuata]|uniref:Ankyrin repeat-containing protein n=1 Tax=Nicotiana attenuata TaxID=49451 RepID=A0A314KXF7_NICAT|nr:PREDICTED: serine/threonine-protein phosphatase 6 regulatory ankyrin repeat subunit B-like [Nicotiana attenuata]XP_019223663.1 PREDICTED: serine/threonine-protein phosphatase 6 regulatory ankyrin repeat subunit B-like [Nicotiana attenuata]OIT33902.1 ankyrin repeat-containing protein [Nicotiana attenuata]
MPPSYFPLRWESTGDQWWYASPIDYAAANGHYDLVRELLRLDGNHLIKLTSLRRIRRLESVWDDEEQFDDVARCRSQVARKLMLECDTKKGKNSLLKAGYGGWLLYTAASAGDLVFVQELLERNSLLVFGEGEYGVTDILYAAARSKSCDLFRVLFDFAVSPRFLARDYGGELDNKHIGEVPSAYKWEMMNRGIHAAARGGNLQVLKELLADCCDDILTYRDIQGATPLHAAAGKGQVEVVKHLIKCFDIINSTDNQGNTALHIAASRGQLAVVEALIVALPSLVCLRNNAGETFLHVAITGFETPCFRRLDHQIQLMKQLVCGKFFNVEEIVNAENNDGRTALHLAVIGNIHSELVELLMTVPAVNVNTRDKDGMTPLDILRQRPHSASSELLTKQLISAGGILSHRDYSARRVVASHLKMQNIGSSPGTSFRLSDTEIFLYTGIERDGYESSELSIPTEQSQHNVSTETCPRNGCKPSSANNAAQRLKRFFHWPKIRKGDKKFVDRSSAINAEAAPVPLRQRFSKPSSLPNNKRTLSVRSNVPSPTAKKKLASGLVNGVMLAIPHLSVRRRSSCSSSFSVSSISSHTSLDQQKATQIENALARASCSNHVRAKSSDSTFKHITGNKSLVNQYLCFGTSEQTVKATSSRLQPYEIYERSVLSTA